MFYILFCVFIIYIFSWTVIVSIKIRTFRVRVAIGHSFWWERPLLIGGGVRVGSDWWGSFLLRVRVQTILSTFESPDRDTKLTEKDHIFVMELSIVRTVLMVERFLKDSNLWWWTSIGPWFVLIELMIWIPAFLNPSFNALFYNLLLNLLRVKEDRWSLLWEWGHLGVLDHLIIKRCIWIHEHRILDLGEIGSFLGSITVWVD